MEEIRFAMEYEYNQWWVWLPLLAVAAAGVLIGYTVELSYDRATRARAAGFLTASCVGLAITGITINGVFNDEQDTRDAARVRDAATSVLPALSMADQAKLDLFVQGSDKWNFEAPKPLELAGGALTVTVLKEENEAVMVFEEDVK